MLPALRLLQALKGWLPPEGMELVAEKLEVTPGARLRGRHLLRDVPHRRSRASTSSTCAPTSPARCGARRSCSRYLEQKLGIKAGEANEQVLPARDRVPRLLRHRALPADQRRPPREPHQGEGGRDPREAQPEPPGSDAIHGDEKVDHPRTGASPDSSTLDGLPGKRGGYAALKKALEMPPAAIIDEVKKSQPARPRRRRLPHRPEVELRPQGQPQAQVPRGQRRRVRAGHRSRTATSSSTTRT